MGKNEKGAPVCRLSRLSSIGSPSRLSLLPKHAKRVLEKPINSPRKRSSLTKNLKLTTKKPSNRCYIFEMSTDARVVSQSMCSVQPLAVLSNAMVKFSTAEGSVDAFMSIRAKSSDGPG